MMGGFSTYNNVAFAAGLVGTFVFVVAAILSFFVPEPAQEEFAEALQASKEASAKPAGATAA
jgi:hypothetical protein